MGSNKESQAHVHGELLSGVTAVALALESDAAQAAPKNFGLILSSP